MNDRQAVRYLADLAAGLDPDYPQGGLPDAYRGAARGIEDLLLTSQRKYSAAEMVRKACEGQPHAKALTMAILRALPSEAEYRSLQDLAAELAPIDWVWPGWIPRGMLSLLGAAPGAGKSLVALDLGRRIIHGQGFPDGTEVPRPGANIVYIDAEAVPQIQNERAVAWGMDRERLYLMLPGDAYSMIDLGDQMQQEQLQAMCAALEPELVVVDSLSAISVKGENNVEDVRGLLGFLMNLARENACGVLLIHHLRKRGQTPMMDLVSVDDLRGSGHIIAMSRSVLALSVIQDGPEPNRNGPRRLEVIKTNLCKYPPALGLLLQEGKGAPVLAYTDAPRAYREPNEAEQCSNWLERVLAEETEGMEPRALVTLAAEEGWSRRTLYNARDMLGEAVVDVGPAGQGRRWALASWG